MGKMKNIYIQMKNEGWDGTPAEYLKKILKEIEYKKHVEELYKKNK
tara:strand:- start:383 stop:520 length:138 start_codon:yes stop_codon:yes gene_type:complete